MRSVCIFQKWFSGRHKPGDYRILIITLVHSRHIIVQKISKIQLTPTNSFWENQRFVIFKKCDFLVFHKITFYCSVLWQNAIHHLKENVFLNILPHICISSKYFYAVKKLFKHDLSDHRIRSTSTAHCGRLGRQMWLAKAVYTRYPSPIMSQKYGQNPWPSTCNRGHPIVDFWWERVLKGWCHITAKKLRCWETVRVDDMMINFCHPKPLRVFDHHVRRTHVFATSKLIAMIRLHPFDYSKSISD